MKVLAITGTSGRHNCIENAVDMFLNQTYTNCHMLIFQNSEVYQELDERIQGKNITLINCHTDKDGQPFKSFGAIYNAILEHIPEDVDVVTLWDDDDLFAPNHIEEGVKGLLRTDKVAYKPRYSFYKDGKKSRVLTENTLEPSIFMWKRHLLTYGFNTESHEMHKAWLEPLYANDDIFIDPTGVPTFTYMWGNVEETVFKSSGDIHNPNNFINYKKASGSHGDGIITPLSYKKTSLPRPTKVNLEKELLTISAQPANKFYAWQIEVQINNFAKYGLDNKMEVLFWHLPGDSCPDCLKLVDKYPNVRFFFYEDRNSLRNDYIPVIRPHVLKQHFEVHRDRLRDKAFFYHDADIIFNFQPDFKSLLTDEIDYVSDTRSYLNYDYLKTKEKEGNVPPDSVVKYMAQVGNTTLERIKQENNNTGGAQYILKNIDAEFWAAVEESCLKIARYLKGYVNKQFFSSENAGFQSFCSDMWAVQYNLWGRGHTTKIAPQLEFGWATDLYEVAKTKPIFHNAGVTDRDKHMFNKNDWKDQSPIGKFKDKWGGELYIDAIRSVKI